MFFQGMPGTQAFTTTDLALGTAGKPTRVFGAELLSGGTASTVIFRNGTSTGGTNYMQLDGTISKATHWDSTQGILFPAGCFVDVDANTANLTVSFTQEL
jgi:hypothetical protein